MSANRHEPLDADERELARVLRALPAGEPPSSLDAKILGMARDAVVSTPSVRDEARPSRAPRVTWGLGVAASCVLAAGLVWRMGGFGGESLDVVGSAAPAEATADAAAAAPLPQPAPPMPEAESAHIAVEIGSPRAAAKPVILPPPPPPAEAPARQRAAPVSMENLASERREQAPEARASDAAVAPEPTVADDAFAMPPPAAAPAAPAPASAAPAAAMAEQAELQRVVVTGSRINPDLARPVAEDGNAGAQAWLQRIRARIAGGDDAGARESLEAYIVRHPEKPLPQDLIDFRNRTPHQ